MSLPFIAAADVEVERYVGRVQGADPADPDNTLGRTPGRF